MKNIYAQTVDKQKMRKIRSIDVYGTTHRTINSAYENIPKPYFQGWKMLYSSLIGSTKKMRIANGYSDRYETLTLMSDYGVHTHSKHHLNNDNIDSNFINNDTNGGTICWHIHNYDYSGNYCVKNTMQQLDTIELNPKEIHVTIDMDMYDYDMKKMRDDCSEYLEMMSVH